MANDSTNLTGEAWPLPRLRFEVRWDRRVMSFQEVTGLDTESQPIEQRRGDSPLFSPIKMPGLKKYGSVTLKRGVFTSDRAFWDWFNQIKLNTTTRVPVTISLLDEAGRPTTVWTLAGAWPVKMTGVDLNAEGNDVAVESLEIGHEGLTVANG